MVHYKETESSREAICGADVGNPDALTMWGHDVTCPPCQEMLQSAEPTARRKRGADLTGEDLGFKPDYDAPVISSYTEEQAVDDGTLVKVSDGDRVTRPAFEFMCAHLGDTPPSYWPVDLMGYATARSKAETLDEVGLRRAVAAALGLIAAFGPGARKVYDENLGGGIYTLFAQTGSNGADGDVITRLVPVGGHDADHVDHGAGRRLWLLPNEVGGLTLMFPEDY